MEKDTNSRIDDLAGKIDTSRAKVQKVEDDLHGALARIAALEQGGRGGQGRAPGGELRRNTIVFHSGIKIWTSFSTALTTSPLVRAWAPAHGGLWLSLTSAFDLATLLVRRMLEIIQEISKAGLELQGGKRPLWASFSKMPAERGRASVAGSHHQGCAWLGDLQVAGMGARAEG